MWQTDRQRDVSREGKEGVENQFCHREPAAILQGKGPFHDWTWIYFHTPAKTEFNTACVRTVTLVVIRAWTWRRQKAEYEVRWGGCLWRWLKNQEMLLLKRKTKMQSLLLSGVSGGGEILRKKRQKSSRPLRGGKEKEPSLCPWDHAHICTISINTAAHKRAFRP